MTITKIHNTHAQGHCPCCRSLKVRNVGEIQCHQPTQYSSMSVELSRAPQLWRCLDCKSGFVQNAVLEEDSMALYGQGNSQDRWLDRLFEQARMPEVVDSLADLLRSTKRVLDVGCSSGEFLDFAKARGASTFGVEYSLMCQEKLRSKGHVAYQSLDEVSGSFDMITAFDLVEHLYDINQFVTRCHELLHPGGLLVIVTGNIQCLPAWIAGANWWYSKFPEHVVFPSRIYFESLVGFRLIRWKATFASPVFVQPLRSILVRIIKDVLKNRYTGTPSFLPDHAFVVLQK